MASDDLSATPGAKMNYLIRRKPATSREELVAHWFANHMPSVIEGQHILAGQNKAHATRYIASLFDAGADGTHSWDGVAQLWYETPPPKADPPHGTTPRDTFQQNAEPYVPWATTEYVVMNGSDRIPVEPLTLNPPFPCTRSGFLKITFLVRALPDTNYADLFTHWLGTHVPNVRGVMKEVGGFRYVVSHSMEPDSEAYAGMAELYFADADSWRRYKATIETDGMEQWVDPAGTLALRGQTEMIGIP